jgi:hypothetical protein
MAPVANNLSALVLSASMIILQACSNPNADKLAIEANELARFDSDIRESSALALHGDYLWTLNDSGGDAEIFKLGTDGEQLETIEITNARNVDWESLAQDEEFLYIADTGNNANRRDSFVIYRVAWEKLTELEASADIINFRYGDYDDSSRFSHNFDAEGLTVRGEELWLFSKNRGDGATNLYRFPKVPGSYEPMPSQTLLVDSLVTAADINPLNGDLALLSSGRSNIGGENYLWIAPTSDAGVGWGSMRSFLLSPSDQWEAMAWDTENGNLILSHERNRRHYSGLATISINELKKYE